MERQKAKERAVALSDLETNVSSLHKLVQIDPENELYKRYPPDRLFELADTYATTAKQDSSDLDAARLARAALVHLAKFNMFPRRKPIADPRAVDLAKQYYDQNIEPLSSAAIMILARHHRLNDDLHSSQCCESVFTNGFDANNPIAVYVLATEVHSNFRQGDAAENILENWPEPEHPWNWRLPDAAKHSYQDKVKALQQISSECASAYASILDIANDSGPNPTEQYEKLDELSAAVKGALSSEKIFLYMLNHLDAFRSQPKLVFEADS